MGLDMYLAAERYVSTFTDNELQEELSALMNKHSVSPIPQRDGDLKSIIVKIVMVYWRKANQIHAWFVDNTAAGVDNCQPILVSHVQLEELVWHCNTLLTNRDLHKDGEITEDELLKSCNELLPPQSGFFFGSTDIDEWYWNDIQHTYDSLTTVLNFLEAEQKAGHDWDLIYRANW